PLREDIDSATPSLNTYSTVTSNAAVSTVSTSSREPFDAANPENSTVSTPLREDIDSATPSFNTYPTVTSNAAVSTVSTSSRELFDAANSENSTVSTPSGTTDIQPQRDTQKNNIALEFSNVYFRYSRDTGDVLRGLDFKVRENEIYFILGGNGSGKSTALSNAAGILKPYSGRIKIFDTLIKKLTPEKLHGEYVAMLPQNVKTLFMFNTVREELEDSGTDGAELGYDFSPLLSRHPYDLSGGQQQLVALAKVLAGKPKILLLDEPTKGLDAYTKAELSRLIFRLRERGMTVIAVTHDAGFAAATADRCALFFRGEIVSEEAPRRFFSLNTFYTTAAARMASGLLPDIATVADIAEALRK
ncbi:MAG: ATP-binding cassette domain-containing protein, partial [Clostridia bacterium]|nr:ATP-binding cassette domain-containing protein [Clostridia bacterium]